MVTNLLTPGQIDMGRYELISHNAMRMPPSSSLDSNLLSIYQSYFSLSLMLNITVIKMRRTETPLLPCLNSYTLIPLVSHSIPSLTTLYKRTRRVAATCPPRVQYPICPSNSGSSDLRTVLAFC
ncbi:unnamed protein product [Hymenolepis diminuta]|uniref:Uncharacterized protein n=1 Tax=Hymenolepis diminuta TaxID=6216 RepID=A0A564YXI6_HYMDI|nr:unnamed protein product [Hymenolepis diminuta]VUZ51900.1 unnamed protein product [Hymenolepis diminuta]